MIHPAVPTDPHLCVCLAVYLSIHPSVSDWCMLVLNVRKMLLGIEGVVFLARQRKFMQLQWVTLVDPHACQGMTEADILTSFSPINHVMSAQ